MGASGRRGEGGEEGGITKDREGVRGAFAGPPAREEHDAHGGGVIYCSSIKSFNPGHGSADQTGERKRATWLKEEVEVAACLIV
jgi:hypothetical protein